jgi:hypothetical protein
LDDDGTTSIVVYAAAAVNEAEIISAADPVLLGRSHAPWPGRLEGFISSLHLLRNLGAGLEVEALHVSNGLVDATYRTGVAYGALGALLRMHVQAENATDAYLADVELLSAL